MHLTIFRQLPANPIAAREIRAYEYRVPLAIRRAETVGVVAVSLVLCVYIVMRWLVERSAMPLYYVYMLMNFETSEYVQLAVTIVYVGVLMRCTNAGVSVAHAYKRHDDLVMTGIDCFKIIRGQWSAALYQVRGWMVALGLIRMTAMLVLTLDFQSNVYWNALPQIGLGSSCCFDPNLSSNGYLPITFLLGLGFIVLLGLIEVWATTGLGILVGTWVRSDALAWVIANLLRALPILIFSWFPIGSGGAFDLPSVRWYEYTWFAFADGGTGAVLRLTYPAFAPAYTQWDSIAHALIAFFAAVHMLLIFGIGSYLLAGLYWRRLGALSEKSSSAMLTISETPKKSLVNENIVVIIAAVVCSIFLMLLWYRSSGVLPSPDCRFDYNLPFLGGIRLMLGIIVEIATIRALIAGVNHGRIYQNLSRTSPLSIRAILRLGSVAYGQLRGWWFGLGIVLMTAFGLLIIEHLVNFYGEQFLKLANCGSVYFGWLPMQWILGLAMTIIVSGLILLSSIMIGIATGMTLRSPKIALTAGIAIRFTPVIWGLLQPSLQLSPYVLGLQGIRGSQNPVMFFLDTGISGLLTITDPSHGPNTTGYSILFFTLVIYMLLGYIFLSVVLIRQRYRP